MIIFSLKIEETKNILKNTKTIAELIQSIYCISNFNIPEQNSGVFMLNSNMIKKINAGVEWKKLMKPLLTNRNTIKKEKIMKMFNIVQEDMETIKNKETESIIVFMISEKVYEKVKNKKTSFKELKYYLKSNEKISSPGAAVSVIFNSYDENEEIINLITIRENTTLLFNIENNEKCVATVLSNYI